MIEPIVIDQEVLYTLLVSATRYAVGRSSYVTSTMADIVRTFAPRLSTDQQRVILRDISEELVLAEGVGWYLGMEQDHKVWRKLVADLIAMSLKGET